MEIKRTIRKGLAVCCLCVSIVSSHSSWGIVLPEESEETKASLYIGITHGQRTASGELYDQGKLSCSHPTLPFGTVVRIQNQETGRAIDVKVNDRAAPGKQGIQLSAAAAQQLGLHNGHAIAVLATPIGVTTAQLQPDYNYQGDQRSFDPSAYGKGESYQQNAIPVAFGAQQDYQADNSHPLQQSAIPVAFVTSPEPKATTQVSAAKPADSYVSSNSLAEYPPLLVDDYEQVKYNNQPADSHTLIAANSPVQRRNFSPMKRSLVAAGQNFAPASPANANTVGIPIRAQFGSFANPLFAYQLSNELNTIGFDTVVMENSQLHCVVTRATFQDQQLADSWISKVEQIHQRKLEQVRY